MHKISSAVRIMTKLLRINKIMSFSLLLWDLSKLRLQCGSCTALVISFLLYKHGISFSSFIKNLVCCLVYKFYFLWCFQTFTSIASTEGAAGFCPGAQQRHLTAPSLWGPAESVGWHVVVIVFDYSYFLIGYSLSSKLFPHEFSLAFCFGFSFISARRINQSLSLLPLHFINK